VKYKHKHGTKNPVIEQEEKSILLSVDRSLSSSSNSQTVGRNGELPLLSFLNRYLPPTFRSVSGHFITPNGNISPQIDIMVLDSRYPLLAENMDGSVLAMLHSVVWTIEVKTNITVTDIKKISNDVKKIRLLMNEIDIFNPPHSFCAPTTFAFAYRTRSKLESIERAYYEHCQPNDFHYDLTILRSTELEANSEKIGCQFHFEPTFDEKVSDLQADGFSENEIKVEHVLLTMPSHTPLSDFYYSLVQSGYYSLGDRNFSFHDIGAQIMSYMSWSTASWNEIKY
jgi:hypothetical protein